MIEIENLNQSFGNRHILRDVNLQINNEETLVILGASGSGKSTLLKLIIGLIKPTSGKIFINGKDITLMNEDALNEQRIHMGMVFQYSALFDSMSVKENIVFGIRQHRQCSENEIDTIVKEKLHLIGLDDIQDLMPANLSGGMKKRVSLARAIALEPDIILYDEPTAGLDPIRATDISCLIKRTQEVMHTTSIVVTHDLKSAFYLADRIAFLYKGQFLFIGTTDELTRSKDNRIQQFIQGKGSFNQSLSMGGESG